MTEEYLYKNIFGLNMKMKLYDMEKQEWRKGNFKRSDGWRSKAIYECSVCQIKNNSWFMGGYPGMGPRIMCPGKEYEEHKVLEQTLEKWEGLGEKIKDYKKLLKKAKNQEKIKNLLSYLEAEKELLEIKFKDLRKEFQGLDDLRGVDSKAKIISYYSPAEYSDVKSLKKRKMNLLLIKK